MTPRTYRRSLAMICVTLWLCGIGAATALAAPAQPAAVAAISPAFVLSPAIKDANVSTSGSHFLFNASQGTTRTESIRVMNTGNQSGAVKLYAVDATSTATGDLAFQTAAAPKIDVGAWVTLDAAQLTLAPGQSQVIGMTLTVPSGATAGQHEGGIVAENLTTQTATDSTHLKVTVVHEFIMRVDVDLPGTLFERLEITGVTMGGSSGYQAILVGLKNSGTQIVAGSGTVVVSQASTVLQQLTFAFSTLLPGAAIQYPLNVQKKALAVGDYTAAVTVKYGDNHVVQDTVTLHVTNQDESKVFGPPGPLNAPAGASINILLLGGMAAAVLVLLASSCSSLCIGGEATRPLSTCATPSRPPIACLARAAKSIATSTTNARATGAARAFRPSHDPARCGGDDPSDRLPPHLCACAHCLGGGPWRTRSRIPSSPARVSGPFQTASSHHVTPASSHGRTSAAAVVGSSPGVSSSQMMS